MARISIEGGALHIVMRGWDRLFAAKGQLTVPLTHIAGVEVRPEEARAWFHGLRWPGTNLPGVITAGTFITDEGRVFYDVHDPERTIAIELHDETYKRLVVEVAADDTPEEAAARISAALG